MNDKPKYITWPALDPKPEDALIFHRRWAEARGKKHLRQIARQLAHDYAVAKCAALPVGDCQECGERWPLRKAGGRYLCEGCWSEEG